MYTRRFNVLKFSRTIVERLTAGSRFTQKFVFRAIFKTRFTPASRMSVLRLRFQVPNRIPYRATPASLYVYNPVPVQELSERRPTRLRRATRSRSHRGREKKKPSDDGNRRRLRTNVCNMINSPHTAPQPVFRNIDARLTRVRTYIHDFRLP